MTKALKKNKDERYRTIQELIADLKTLRKRLDFEADFDQSRISFGNDLKHNFPQTPESEIQVAEKAKTTAVNADQNELTIDMTATAATGAAPQFKTAESVTTNFPKNRKYVFSGGLTMLLLTIIGLVYYLMPPGKTPLATDAKKSLAVLPFVNISQDSNAEYLSDGITESIINNLSQISRLKVMSRNSAFRFKNDQTDARAIAAQLNVETLVTSDIKQIGDRLIINVRLIDPKDDSQIWGNQYVKTSGDVIAVQTEIAQAVANNLRLRLSNSEQQSLGKKYTENAEAYAFYLRGRYQYFKLTEPEIRQAIVFYQQPIDADPTYASAYVGMADAYRTLPIAGWNAAPKEVMPQAKAAANKALEIDPNLAEAHMVLGWIGFLYDWNGSAAENELKKAIELSPNNADIHRSYGQLLSNAGRHTEAIAEIRRSRELDPLTLITNALEGQFLFYAGRETEAILRFQKTLELDPIFWVAHNGLGRVYLRQERFDEAIAAFKIATELSSGNSTEPITQLGYALAKSGDRDGALIKLAELKALAAKRFVPAYSFAMIYIGLGAREEALNHLEKSFQEREVQLTFIKIDMRWDELRDEPRFVKIIKDMNLE